MSEYTPVLITPREWYYADCPFGCEMPVRASKEALLPKSIKRHITEAHKGKVLPTAPVPKVKSIYITRVYYSGASKKLSVLVPLFKDAWVSGHFPGDSGCAVVKSEDRILIYPSLGAGVKGWHRLEWPFNE